jgi:hypothetical protein
MGWCNETPDGAKLHDYESKSVQINYLKQVRLRGMVVGANVLKLVHRVFLLMFFISDCRLRRPMREQVFVRKQHKTP